MICRNSRLSSSPIRIAGLVLFAGLLSLGTFAEGQKKTAPAKPSAPAAKPAAKPAATGAKPSTSTAGHTSPGSTARPGAGGGAGAKTGASAAVKAPPGGSVHTTANGGAVAKNSKGQVTAYKGASGHEAKFDSKGHVSEVHANGVTVHRGPGGARRTEVERADHSRVVAYGHGRGYIQHEYRYGGHAYYSRAYYYHGGYYNAYYHPYYYNGVYLHGYMPSYYYPPVYYGWAYNPWPAPVAYGWGWGAAPWYGYYGAYFAPYPVYPSAAFWIADYMVAASLAEAYAGAAANNADLRHIDSAHLVYASYDPATGTTSPTMTKEVKDAVADEIKLELAAGQKTADPANGSSGSLEALLADGKPHVFVDSTALTVDSSGSDCGLTEGDVLALNAPPAKDDAKANLRVLASKQNDCAKGNVVSVDLTDLQEMHNHLLSNIDKGMAEMKDHPGQGGLPAPPADAISGTKQAPYAAAAPAADPNGASEVDETAKQGADTEQQVVAEATAQDSAGGGTSQSASPIGGLASSGQPAPPAAKGPVTISLGQTPEEVISAKGQPTSKVNLGTKIVYNYPDMKVIFVHGKVSDVQ